GESAEAGAARAAGAADAEAAEVATAHGGAPRRLDLARFVVGRDTVVDDDVRVRHTADRAVEIMDRRARIGGAAPGIVGPLTLLPREVHRLRIDELRALHGVLYAHSEARVQQIRHRSGLARVVVLVVHEGRVLDRMKVVVE